MRRSAAVSPSGTKTRSTSRSPSGKSARRSPSKTRAGAGAPRIPEEVHEVKKAPVSRAQAFQEAGALAEDMVAKRDKRERAAKELTLKEKKGAVGDWLFGEGGIRGLSLANQKAIKGAIDRRQVEAGGQGVASGMVVNTAGLSKQPQRGAGTGRAAAEPTRLEYVMQKYQRRTEAAVKKREDKAGKLKDKGPRPIREKVPVSVKEDAKQAVTGCFKRCRNFFDVCWSGPKYDQVKELDKAPIVFGGIYRKIVERVGVTQPQLKKLRDVFRGIDVGGMGDIALVELFEYLDEPMTLFGKRLYQQVIETQIGDNPDMVLNFENFMMFVIVFGLLSKRDLLQFVFDTFDADGSGYLDEDELAVLLAVVNNDKPLYPGNFARVLNDFDTDGDGRISIKELTVLNKTYPAALFPAFRLHDQLQRRTLGAAEFLTLARNTAELRADTAAKQKARFAKGKSGKPPVRRK